MLRYQIVSIHHRARCAAGRGRTRQGSPSACERRARDGAEAPRGAQGRRRARALAAESLEVQYEDKHTIEDLQWEDALLKVEMKVKELVHTAAASNAVGLSSRLASAEGHNLELSMEKREMVASLEAALKRSGELEE
jgi:hypothetical protein